MLLQQAGVSVKAATRNPAQYAGSAGVTPVEFDLEQSETFEPALAGVDRVFAIAKSGDAQPQAKLNPLIDAARSAGVRHVALLTARGVEMSEDIGLRKVERHLMASGLAYTILRPTWYMQNFSVGFIRPMIAQTGAIFLAAGDGKTSFIHTDDIAAVAAAALTRPGHEGQEYTLTGGRALSYGEAADIISAASGRPIGYVPISSDQMRQSLIGGGWPPESADFMTGLFYPVQQGWAAGVSPDVALVLGRQPITFEQFAAENAAVWQ